MYKYISISNISYNDDDDDDFELVECKQKKKTVNVIQISLFLSSINML